MGMEKKRVLIVVAVVAMFICLPSAAYADEGTATYYTPPYVPTNQGVPQPCKGNSVVVKIVDYCPPGCRGTIDLSQEAFAAIADPNAGKIKIRYTRV